MTSTSTFATPSASGAVSGSGAHAHACASEFAQLRRELDLTQVAASYLAGYTAQVAWSRAERLGGPRKVLDQVRRAWGSLDRAYRDNPAALTELAKAELRKRVRESAEASPREYVVAADIVELRQFLRLSQNATAHLCGMNIHVFRSKIDEIVRFKACEVHGLAQFAGAVLGMKSKQPRISTVIARSRAASRKIASSGWVLPSVHEHRLEMRAVPFSRIADPLSLVEPYDTALKALRSRERLSRSLSTLSTLSTLLPRPASFTGAHVSDLICACGSLRGVVALAENYGIEISREAVRLWSTSDVLPKDGKGDRLLRALMADAHSILTTAEADLARLRAWKLTVYGYARRRAEALKAAGLGMPDATEASPTDTLS